MPKVKYDVSDVEPGTDFDTPVPRGTYRCKVTDVKHGKSQSSGRDMLTVEYEIASGEWKNRKLWDYIVLDDSSAWKLRQFTDALGKRAKGTLDTDSVVGEVVLVRVKHETDDRDPEEPVVRARVGSVNKLPEDADDEEEAEDDEPDEDEEPEEEDDEEDDEEEDEDDDEEEDEDEDGEYTREDIDGYSRAELEAIIEADDLDVSHNKKTKLNVLRDRVAEALGLDEEDDEDEDDDEEGEDYEDMSLADLRAALKERGLSTKGRKPALVKRLEKDDEEDDDEEPF